MKPNVRGFFSCTDADTLEALAIALGLPDVPESVEGDFIAEIYSTPGRIMTLDPADAYPDEHEDYRELTNLLVYYKGTHEMQLITDGEKLWDATDIIDDYMYAADVEPLHEPSDPWED